MSNYQWQADQAVGEAAMRELDDVRREGREQLREQYERHERSTTVLRAQLEGLVGNIAKVLSSKPPPLLVTPEGWASPEQVRQVAREWAAAVTQSSNSTDAASLDAIIARVLGGDNAKRI